MVTKGGGSECEERRREEHGFVVGMGDQEADALVAEDGEGGAGHVGGVEPEGY